MDISPVEVRYYQTAAGRCPFRAWFSLRGRAEQAVIDARITRLRRGLAGDQKYLGNGIHELRFHAGPGYRIYFGKDGRTLLILLIAGDKKSQPADIENARVFWEDYLRRTRP